MKVAFRKMTRAPSATIQHVAAPLGGWNARDGLDGMEAEDAVVLDNWFPGNGKISMRRGYVSYATGLGGDVLTLAEFNAGTARKFIAAANGNIWDISSTGAGTSLASGFTDNRWQWAQFDDASGGARIGLVNGTDAPQIYNGTTIGAMTVSGTGLTADTLDGINIFKGRSYFWSSNTQDYWWSAVNALGGTLTKFPLGRVQGTGGNLIAMGTWTRDGGDGLDDLACFVLSSGDVLVYAGDNPGDAAAWALQGVFKIGAPLSIRGVRKIGTDLLILTKDGWVPLSAALKSGRTSGKFAISNKIQAAAIVAAQDYGSNVDWDICHYPRSTMLVINVPISGTAFQQHVMNTETGAWCRFTNIPARCWQIYNDLLYFGGAGGVVYRADIGRNDAGTAITARAQSAFNYFGNRGRIKRFTSHRMLLNVFGGSVQYKFGLAIDFAGVSPVLVHGTASAGASTVWDLAAWDVSPWTSEQIISDRWAGAAGLGYCASTRVEITSGTQEIDWYSTGYMFEMGGGI